MKNYIFPLFIFSLLVFGCDKDESTPADKNTVPTLITLDITNITNKTAISGGSIINNGGDNIIASGVVWSTTSNPTVALTTKTTDSNTSSFFSNITDLSENTTYYVRAYATNSIGTAYGNEIKFTAASSFTAFDNALFNKMKQLNIPGMSIAVTRNEKLVYQKSYGISDIEANTIAKNDDLYRIASISKPITVIAILKLVEDKKLTLDQKVFGPGSILGNDYGPVPKNSNKDLITVKHLIDHTSGWTNVPDDPMFRDYNFTQKQLITDLLANRPLTNGVGSTYYYLNFGYSVLGRVIEKVTGSTYEEFVKSKILAPCGITTMKIGGSKLNERVPKEVKYYYHGSFSPYAMNIARFDAHGGWLASSKDLAKFIVKVDRKTAQPDIVSSSLLSQTYFGFENWYHTGQIAGSSALLRRVDDTFNFAILSNYTYDIEEINSLIVAQIKSIKNWPTTDLFKE